MSRNKTKLYIVQPSAQADTRAASAPTATRLIRGTLKEVEWLLRGEWEVRPATAEESHSMADVEIEQATGEPV